LTQLFDSEIKSEDQIQTFKVIAIFVKFSREVQEVLKDMQKLLFVVIVLNLPKDPEMQEGSKPDTFKIGG